MQTAAAIEPSIVDSHNQIVWQMEKERNYCSHHFWNEERYILMLWDSELCPASDLTVFYVFNRFLQFLAFNLLIFHFAVLAGLVMTSVCLSVRVPVCLSGCAVCVTQSSVLWQCGYQSHSFTTQWLCLEHSAVSLLCSECCSTTKLVTTSGGWGICLQTDLPL